MRECGQSRSAWDCKMVPLCSGSNGDMVQDVGDLQKI